MSEDSSNASSEIPSADGTSVDSGENSSNNGGDSSPPLSVDIIDRSQESDHTEKALKLKDQGNEQLLAGHFLQAIGFYSEALEYDPTNAVILSNRAQAFIKVENYGLAMADATAASESDPTYAKAYYRRGSAHFALTHLKEARKDFRQVCKLKPKDRDARSKLAACEKAIKQEAFLKAIESENTAPLSATYDPSNHSISDSYDGPHPAENGPTSDMDLEASLFEPGNLPRAFVLVSKRAADLGIFEYDF
jgi:serine/threonine-protein phosphatase 5